MTTRTTVRKIRFRQSGGFAGLIRGCDLDLASLDEGERTKLERAVAKSGLVEKLAEKDDASSRASSSARDTAQIEIEIETPTGTVRHELDELDLPPAAEPLLSMLQDRSRPLPLDR